MLPRPFLFSHFPVHWSNTNRVISLALTREKEKSRRIEGSAAGDHAICRKKGGVCQSRTCPWFYHLFPCVSVFSIYLPVLHFESGKVKECYSPFAEIQVIPPVVREIWFTFPLSLSLPARSAVCYTPMLTAVHSLSSPDEGEANPRRTVLFLRTPCSYFPSLTPHFFPRSFIFSQPLRLSRAVHRM